MDGVRCGVVDQPLTGAKRSWKSLGRSKAFAREVLLRVDGMATEG